METKEKKQLLPFDVARLNIRKTAENFNFYNSVEVLALAIKGLNTADPDAQETGLEEMCQNIIKEMCAMMIDKGGSWN